MATLDTEIRKLQPVELYTLAQILNQSDCWKKLMAIIPKEDNENQYMFNDDHFKMIEQAIRQQQRSGADIFLSEWSTLNKKRPTCSSMLSLLIKAELFRAADYLAIDILKMDPPERPKIGPAAAIDVSEDALVELLKQQVANLESGPKDSEQSSMSWSLHFAEKPINVMSGNTKKGEENIDGFDLMKFNTDKSDLLKFSTTNEELRNLPDQMSDLMKFSTEATDETPKMESYVLQEARSEDIPLCVKENAFQSIKSISSGPESAESVTTTDSIDVSQRIPSQQVDLPVVSESIIPVVVLEYNEKERNKTNT